MLSISCGGWARCIASRSSSHAVFPSNRPNRMNYKRKSARNGEQEPVASALGLLVALSLPNKSLILSTSQGNWERKVKFAPLLRSCRAKTDSALAVRDGRGTASLCITQYKIRIIENAPLLPTMVAVQDE